MCQVPCWQQWPCFHFKLVPHVTSAVALTSALLDVFFILSTKVLLLNPNLATGTCCVSVSPSSHIDYNDLHSDADECTIHTCNIHPVSVEIEPTALLWLLSDVWVMISFLMVTLILSIGYQYLYTFCWVSVVVSFSDNVLPISKQSKDWPVESLRHHPCPHLMPAITMSRCVSDDRGDTISIRFDGWISVKSCETDSLFDDLKTGRSKVPKQGYKDVGS